MFFPIQNMVLYKYRIIMQWIYDLTNFFSYLFRDMLRNERPRAFRLSQIFLHSYQYNRNPRAIMSIYNIIHTCLLYCDCLVTFYRSHIVITYTIMYLYLISGIHLVLTFSREVGDATEKQTRKTSVCGYESGLRRS